MMCKRVVGRIVCGQSLDEVKRDLQESDEDLLAEIDKRALERFYQYP